MYDALISTLIARRIITIGTTIRVRYKARDVSMMERIVVAGDFTVCCFGMRGDTPYIECERIDGGGRYQFPYRQVIGVDGMTLKRTAVSYHLTMDGQSIFVKKRGKVPKNVNNHIPAPADTGNTNGYEKSHG